MVWLPDSPLKCIECGNKQLTITFSKNPQSVTFEQWYLCWQVLFLVVAPAFMFVL